MNSLFDYQDLMFSYGFKYTSLNISADDKSNVFIIVNGQFFKYLFLRKKIKKDIDEKRPLGIKVKLCYEL